MKLKKYMKLLRKAEQATSRKEAQKILKKHAKAVKKIEISSQAG